MSYFYWCVNRVVLLGNFLGLQRVPRPLQREEGVGQSRVGRRAGILQGAPLFLSQKKVSEGAGCLASHPGHLPGLLGGGDDGDDDDANADDTRKAGRPCFAWSCSREALLHKQE